MVRSSSYHGSSSVPSSSAAAGELQQDADAAALRSMVSSQFQYSIRRAARKTTGNPVSDLIHKIQLAWRIFFPEAPKQVR